MFIYKKLLSCVFLTAFYPFSSGLTAETDNLYMKNGDRLSGTIQSYTNDTVTIDTVFGVLNVPVDKIGGVASPRYTRDELLGGTVEPATQTTMVTEPVAPLSNDTAEADEEVEATGWLGAKWSGDVNAGLEINTGNSDNTAYQFDASTEAKWADNDRLKFSAEYENEEENDTTITDEKSAEILYDYFISEKWFLQNNLKAEQDDIEDLNLRLNYLLGLGYQFYDRDDLSLQVSAGPGYLREDYDTRDVENSLTAHWSLEYEQKFYDDLFRLYHNHDLTAPTDEWNAYLFESDSGVTIPLDNGFKVSGEVEFDWNNDPAAGNTEEDTTYNLKLGYEW